MPAEVRDPPQMRSLVQAARAAKITLDRLIGNGPGSKLDTVVTWRDLIDAGVVDEPTSRKIVGED
jgi:hypothetical protein